MWLFAPSQGWFKSTKHAAEDTSRDTKHAAESATKDTKHAVKSGTKVRRVKRDFCGLLGGKDSGAAAAAGQRGSSSSRPTGQQQRQQQAKDQLQRRLGEGEVSVWTYVATSTRAVPVHVHVA